MREAFLQFVWQQQYIAPSGYVTTTGQPVEVLRPGLLNNYSGPDFDLAQVRIGDVNWSGAVEIHYKSSDWAIHQHQQDGAYDHVILHVVWHDDKVIYRSDGSVIPTMVLAGHVPVRIIKKFQAILAVPRTELACANQIGDVSRLVRLSMLDHVIFERLKRKANQVLDLLATNQFDWEATIWQWMAQAYGFKANNAPLLQLAQTISLKQIRKHRNIPRHIEALLLGAAGLLKAPETNPESQSDQLTPDQQYEHQLWQDWQWLKVKFNLPDVVMLATQWKTGGIRPTNSATLRVVQLAALVCHILSFINLVEPFRQAPAWAYSYEPINDNEGRLAPGYQSLINYLTNVLSASPADYWQRHHQIGKPMKPHQGHLGKDSIHSLIINAIAPVVVAYGIHHNQDWLMQQAINLIEFLPPEENAVTRFWGEQLGPLATALDTQAAIELKTQYCEQKRCLSCRIGQAIIKQERT